MEAMLAIPVDKPEQLQKLVDAASSYLVLTDAHKIVAGANLDHGGPAAKKSRRARPSRLRRQPFRRDVEWAASEQNLYMSEDPAVGPGPIRGGFQIGRLL